MKSKLAATTLLAVVLSGCMGAHTDDKERMGVVGAVTGAAAGAALVNGHHSGGHLIGGLAGAVIGGLFGYGVLGEFVETAPLDHLEQPNEH